MQGLSIASKALLRSSTRVKSEDLKKDMTDCEEHAADYRYSSNSDLEGDEDKKVASSNWKHKSRVHSFNPGSHNIPNQSAGIPREEHERDTEGGTIVKIPGIAFITRA